MRLVYNVNRILYFITLNSSLCNITVVSRYIINDGIYYYNSNKLIMPF